MKYLWLVLFIAACTTKQVQIKQPNERYYLPVPITYPEEQTVADSYPVIAVDTILIP